jgi:amino acid transporter
MVKGVELILTVGVILGIIGGVNAGNDFQTTGKFTLGTLSEAGTSLLVVAFAFTVLGVILISFDTPHADRAENRIFLGLVASLPFLLVRLVYSCLSTFSHKSKFSLLSGSTTILLCVALLEELAVVIIFESVGLTLNKTPKTPKSLPVAHIYRESSEPIARRPYEAYEGQPKKKEHIALRIAKHIIIVRLVMMVISKLKKDDKDGGVEMQGQQFGRR